MRMKLKLPAAPSLLLVAAAAAKAADQVSVQLDWVVRGNHAMFFVARDKGYFKDNGIEVTAIRKGTGSVDALRLVGTGNAEFGFGDLPTLAIARSQAVPVVALAAVNQRSPMGMIALAKTKTLSKPEDLKGLDVGVHTAGSTYVFLRAFLAAHGMSETVHVDASEPGHEGWLVGVVDHETAPDTYEHAVWIWNAGELFKGPVAKVPVPTRMRPQVHGWWVPMADYKAAKDV